MGVNVVLLAPLHLQLLKSGGHVGTSLVAHNECSMAMLEAKLYTSNSQFPG